MCASYTHVCAPPCQGLRVPVPMTTSTYAQDVRSALRRDSSVSAGLTATQCVFLYKACSSDSIMYGVLR